MSVAKPEVQRSSASERCSLEKVFNQILTMPSRNTHQLQSWTKYLEQNREI